MNMKSMQKNAANYDKVLGRLLDYYQEQKKARDRNLSFGLPGEQYWKNGGLAVLKFFSASRTVRRLQKR